MQAIDTARRETRGGAPSPPTLLHTDPPPLVLVAPPGGDQLAMRRQSFVRRLHSARERRGVSLEEIAQRTKVSAALLSALERGDASKWPKGLFRRAFFRDYAAAIGLPAEPNVSEFLLLFPDGEDHPTGPVESAAPILRLSLAPQGGWQLSARKLQQEAAAALVVLLIAVGLTLWLQAPLLSLLGIAGLGYSGRVAIFVARQILTARPTVERDAS